ncbi:MAG: ankyrin repeat family protein 2, partial [Gammaproteobacteria bacterium]|nr:ankyrin repeat family protein 2 [Gammaproteobacteria bacterium]
MDIRKFVFDRCMLATVFCVLSWMMVGDSARAAGIPTSGDSLEPARAAIRTKQFELAITELRKQAERGSREAQRLLGIALLNGVSREPDGAQARRWLRAAAEHGDVSAQFVLASLLFDDEKPAVEARLWLERAAQGGNGFALRAVQEKRPPLVAERAAILADTSLRRDLLLWAARRNDSELTGSVLRGFSVDAGDDFGSTALSEAAASGAVDTMVVLLEAHADVNGSDRYGTTPLMRAAAQNNGQAAAMLIAHGGDPKKTDSTGNTALMYAARANQPGQVAALLAAGSELSATNAQGWSALDIAVRNEANEAGAELRARGARPRLAAVSAPEALGIDYSRGAALYRGWSPLFIAVSRDDAAAVNRLLDAGADLKSLVPGGDTLLSVGVQSNAGKSLGS